MKITKILLLSICSALVFSSCLDINSDDTTTTELTTRENYFVANQSELDLTVTYQIESTTTDSTMSVPADSTTQIYKSGGIGDPSTPSSSFANLRFFKQTSDTTSALLTIEPVEDESWNFTAGNDTTPAKYELVITEEDLQ